MPFPPFLKYLGVLLTGWLLLCSGAGAAENGKILMVTEATFPPYEFWEGNTIMGIDPEIMREVARRTGRELVIEDMSFDSVITAVVSGKADVAASGITVTPERLGKVDFSIPYMEAAQVIIVPKGSPIRSRDDIRGRRIGVQHGATGDTYVTRNIQQPERFPNGALAVAAVASGKVDVSKVLVAVVAFGFNSGAYVAEIIRGGIMSIDKGQFEAGRSLGLGYAQTMIFIILPQAFKNVLPALGNEFIVLLKETSVSGYIALQDLTKGGDIIRSQTYTAFMPLTAVALIYLSVVMLFSWLLGKLERRLKNNE